MNLLFELSDLCFSDTRFADDLFMRSIAVPRMHNRAMPLKTDLKSRKQKLISFRNNIFKETFL